MRTLARSLYIWMDVSSTKNTEIHRAPKQFRNYTLPDITKLSSSESSVPSVLFSNRQYVKSEGTDKTMEDLAVSCTSLATKDQKLSMTVL